MTIGINDRSSATAGDGPRNLPEFLAASAHFPYRRIDWPAAQASSIFRLTPTEAATIRITPPTPGEVVMGCGDLSETMFRVALMGQTGALPWASFSHVARVLQYAMFNHHPMALRKSRRATLALASLATLGWVSMEVSGLPTADDPKHYRRMPLADRLRELAAVD